MEKDGVFRVNGRGIELLFERHDASNVEALSYLEQRLRDIGVIAALERAGGRVAAGVQLVLTPASREIAVRLRADGTLDRFEALGAIVTTPGCGACCGTSGVIPGDGVTVLSTANRNVKARMGNPTAEIYLASPAACGAAAATGLVTVTTSNWQLATNNGR